MAKREKRHEAILTFRLPEEERQQIEDQAREKNVPVARLLRFSVRKVLLKIEQNEEDAMVSTK